MRFVIPLALLLCASPTCAALKRKPLHTLVLDSWWGADFAKETCDRANEWQRENATVIAQLGCEAVVSCPEMTSQVAACATGAEQQYRDFENELATEFAGSGTCKGIRFVIFKSPDTVDKAVDQAMAHPHWMLGVDFTPGATKQHWWLNDSDLHSRGTGEATADVIARKVCTIVNERGAAVGK